MALVRRFSIVLILLITGCAGEGHDRRAGSSSDTTVSSSPGTYRISLIPQESQSIPDLGDTLRFRIVDGRDQTLTAYRIVHEKPIHLIVVRRDLGAFQHVHPVMEDVSKKWIVPLTFETEGPHVLFADFHPELPGAVPTVVRRDYFVGDTTHFQPIDWPKETRGRQPNDGLAVDVSIPTVPLQAGGEEKLRFAWVKQDGTPVGLEPYLGSFGHAVALERKVLAYQHAHPDSAASEPAQGVAVFALRFAQPDDYRVFAEFRVGGRLHTVPVTLHVGEAGPGNENAAAHAGH
jgi:hypothetical protein